MSSETLFEKIRSLPPERLAEVEDFVEFLSQRDNSLRIARDEAVAAYAVQYAGVDGIDLDRPLEAAAVERLLEVEE
jgi:hypothetical protein